MRAILRICPGPTDSSLTRRAYRPRTGTRTRGKHRARSRTCWAVVRPCRWRRSRPAITVKKLRWRPGRLDQGRSSIAVAALDPVRRRQEFKLVTADTDKQGWEQRPRCRADRPRLECLMDTKTDYYRILHVQRDAPVEIIKASYRTLMQRLRMHPDLGGDQHNAALLNEAYSTLTDAGKRAAYDAVTTQSAPAGETLSERGAGHRAMPEMAPAAGHCPFCDLAYFASQLDMDDDCTRCASPLFPAERLGLDAVDRRAVERLNRQQPATMFTCWPPSRPRSYCVTARDVSLRGVQLLSPRSLDAPHTVKIDSDLCSAVGRVVRCRRSPALTEPGWLLGVAFITVRFARPRGGFFSARA